MDSMIVCLFPYYTNANTHVPLWLSGPLTDDGINFSSFVSSFETAVAASKSKDVAKECFRGEGGSIVVPTVKGTDDGLLGKVNADAP